MRTSYSALETFRQCPQKYEFQEIKKIKVPKSKEAIFGTLIHDALKYMFSRDPVYPTDDEVVVHFRDGLLSSAIRETERERYLSLGEELLRTYMKKNPPWNANVVALESRFEITIEDAKEHKSHIIAGIIDRIDKLPDGSFEVIDYKTARKLPSQDDINQDRQLSIYHLSVTKRWPHIPPDKIHLSLYFLRASEKLSTKRNGVELAQTSEKIINEVREIEKATQQSSFPPRPSALCDWCGFKPYCPAWKHLYAKKAQSEKDIKPILQEYITLKRETDLQKKRLSQLSSELSLYMNEAGLTRLFHDDAILSKNMQTRSSWDAEVADALLKNTPYYASVTGFDEFKLLHVLKDLPDELREELMEKAQKIKSFSLLKLQKRKNADSETQVPIVENSDTQQFAAGPYPAPEASSAEVK